MRAILLAGVQLALLIGAGSARADDAGDRLKIAREVVATAHVADSMRSIMPMMMAQLKPLVQQGGQVDAARLDKFTKLFTAHAAASADRFADQVAQLYATEFSVGDLQNLLAFYKTPTGQALLAKQPAIAQASFALGKQIGQELGKEVMDEMNKETESKPSKT